MTETGINAFARAVADGTRWRVGEHYSIHVYAGDRPIATFHTALDARRAVEAVNLWITLAERLQAETTAKHFADFAEQMFRTDNHEDKP